MPPPPPTAQELCADIIAASDKLGTLLTPRGRLEHIAALLFIKRASDVYAEEKTAARADLGGIDEASAIIDANPDAYHLLRIPSDASWDALRVDRDKLGAAVDTALRAVATANPRYLDRVFGGVDFNNRQVLPVAALADAVAAVNGLGEFSAGRVPPSVLGAAFLQVVDHFSRQEKPAKGEVFTPGAVARLGARLLAPGPAAQVHDPACGSGGLLMRVRDEARRLHGDGAAAVALFGQERRPAIWLVAQLNAFFHGAGASARIAPGDTVLTPAFFDGSRKFDLCICNPPFELETNDWYDTLRKSGDRFGRIENLPGKSHPELVFAQHMLASLAERGRMAVLLPNGALFRGGAQAEVRKHLVDHELLEAVIQLPKGMFFGSGIPVSWVVINRGKPKDRDRRVLFIDASEWFERVDTTNLLREEDVDRIVSTYADGTETEGFSVWADTDSIKARRYNLTVRRYVRPASSETDLVPLNVALDELDAARALAREADDALDVLLASLRANP